MKTGFNYYIVSFIFGLALSVKGQNITPPDTLIRLQEFEVTGMKGMKVFQPADTSCKKDIERMAARDVGDFLRSRPNVAGIRKGGSGIDPVVRGFKFSQLNIQVNEGQKIESACPNRMDPPTAHIDIDDIQKVEIFKGPYALRFGPNFGGLVHLHTWPATRTGPFTVKVSATSGYESAWNGIKQHLAVTGGNKDFLFKVSGNYKKYGDYKDGNGNTVASSFERYNYSGLLSVTPWKGHSLTASYDRAIGKNLDFPALPMDERFDQTNLYSADYIYDNSGGILQEIHVKYYYSDVRHEMDNKQRPVSDTTVAISTIHALNTGYRAEAGISLMKGTLHAGTDMEDIRKDGERIKYMIMQPTMPVKKEALWDEAHIRNYGLFAEYSKPFGNVTGVVALRYDLNNAGSNPLAMENMQGQPVYFTDSVESEYSNLSFSLGADWKIRDNLVIGLAAGRGVRSPDMTERFIILLPIGYENFDYLGNPGLKPEKNHQADLSVKWSVNKAGQIKAGVFYSYVTGFISGRLVPETVVKPQTKGVYGVKQFINLDKAWLTGFELEYQSPAENKWQLSAVASYTMGVNPEAVRYIVSNGQVTGSEIIKNDPLSEIPPFEGTMRFSWKFFNGKLVPQANVRVVAAQERISVSYSEKDTPAFTLAGLSVYYRFNAALEFNAGVDNLFDVAYYEHLNRNIVGSQTEFYEPGINFFISAKFKVQSSK
ncbi:MAG: TonB-dependent receptor [Bacteroidales bacterium]|nr:TonB-dependent receptor [Bacteroidales bacterium]